MIKEYHSFLSALRSTLEVFISILLRLCDDVIDIGLILCLTFRAFVKFIFDAAGCC